MQKCKRSMRLLVLLLAFALVLGTVPPMPLNAEAAADEGYDYLYQAPPEESDVDDAYDEYPTYEAAPEDDEDAYAKEDDEYDEDPDEYDSTYDDYDEYLTCEATDEATDETCENLLTLSEEYLTLEVDDIFIVAAYLAERATSITWESSNEAVAIVTAVEEDAEVAAITAIAEGEAIITVTVEFYVPAYDHYEYGAHKVVYVELPVTVTASTLAAEIEMLMAWTSAQVNRPFPQSSNNAYARNRLLPVNFAAAGSAPGLMPGATPQQQMDFDTLTRFNNILFAFVVDPCPETRYCPDNFRMVLSMPRHSWVTIEPPGAFCPEMYAHTGDGNMAGVRHMGIMVCESQGFGMLMLPFMAGAENRLVPDIRISRGGTGTGANSFMERNVTLGQNLFNNLPEGLQDAFRARYGPDFASIEIKTYFDAMFRTVRQWPSFEIHRENGTITTDATPDPAVYRRTYMMAWEISTGIPGLHGGPMGVADWIDGARTTPGATTGAGIGNANASFNWFLNYGQPFYDARHINQSHSVATDGQMDIILGLINADAQWGGGGGGGLNFDMAQVAPGETIGYMYWAQGMLEDFWLTVVDRTQPEHYTNYGRGGNYHLKVGNWSTNETAYFNDLGVWMSNATRGSDHMFHHLRVFNAVDLNNDWQKVIDASFEAQRQLVLLRYDQERMSSTANPSVGRPGYGGVNGILPDFAYLNRVTGTWHPAPTTGGGWLEGNSDGTYSWNNVRVPWRFGTDLFMVGRNEVDSLVLGSLHSHVNSVWPNFTGIRSMLLDGRGQSPASGTGVGFWSTFTLAALMEGADIHISDDLATRQAWADLAWSHTRRQAQANNFYADYFKVHAMIVASGNYWCAVGNLPVTPHHYNLLTVRHGYGSGLAPAGTQMEIVARQYPGEIFLMWDVPAGVTFAAGTTVTSNPAVINMPDRDILVSAVYRGALPVSIEVARPGRNRYIVNEPLDTTGMYIAVTYEVDDTGHLSTTLIPVTPDMVTGFNSSAIGEVTLTITYNGLTTTLVVSIVQELRPFPQAGLDTGRVVELYRPSGVTQREMNESVLRSFAQIIIGRPWAGTRGHVTDYFLETVYSQFIVDPASLNDPENFRMLIFLDGGTGPGATTANSRRVTVCESHGYGMFMLVQMAGSEDIPFELFGETVTIRQLLFDALPAVLQDHFGIERVDVRLFYDAMFRSARHWPSHPQHIVTGHHAWGASDGILATPAGNAYRGNRPNNFRPSYTMAWNIHYDTVVGGFRRGPGPSNATDGSMDIAYSLILASEQWGYGPVWCPTTPDGRVYSYLEWARRMVNDLWLVNVHHSTHIGSGTAAVTGGGNYHLKIGNWVSSNAANGRSSRPSDFMMQHLKAFKAIDPGNDWQRVIDTTYGALEFIAMYPTLPTTTSVNPVTNPTGIISDFVRWDHINNVWLMPRQGSGTYGQSDFNPGQSWHESTSDGARHWNACRVPWRLSSDILFSGTTPVEDITISAYNDFSFAASNGRFAVFDNGTLVDGVVGRWLDGTPNWTHSWGLNSWNAFWGPSMLMSAVYGPQEWFDEGWRVANEHAFMNNQYGDYITLFTLIAASGNEWTPVGNPLSVFDGTIIYGTVTGGRRFVYGARVPLVADSLPNMRFSHWELEDADFWPGFDAYSRSTFMAMPNNAAVARAIFEPVDVKPVPGFDIFNNGEGGSPSRPNASLAAAGTIRMWTQLDGVNTRVYLAAADTIEALDQDGNCAMAFITVPEMWQPGGFLPYFNRIDVDKNQPWQYINFSITVFGQTVHVLLINALFEVPQRPVLTFDIFNNGEGGSPSRPNPSLAAAGTIRMWTQLDGVNTRVYLAAADTIEALDQDGNCAMAFLTVPEMWQPGGFLPYFNRIDVDKNQPWQYINFSITAYGRLVELLLVNSDYVPAGSSHTVTFTVEAGAVGVYLAPGATTTVEVPHGEAILAGSIPSAVARVGFYFAGWDPIAPSEHGNVYGNVSFTARFNPLFHYVTFEAGYGGAPMPANPLRVRDGFGIPAGSVPYPEALPGFVFVGWVLEGTAVDPAGFIVRDNITITAVFEADLD